eukprot:7501311-Lingulodinium_polyedra.AAC.1
MSAAAGARRKTCRTGCRAAWSGSRRVGRTFDRLRWSNRPVGAQQQEGGEVPAQAWGEGGSRRSRRPARGQAPGP